MNFYELSKKLNEMSPPAYGMRHMENQPMQAKPGEAIPGANKNLQMAAKNQTEENAPADKQDMRKNLSRISVNLGEKGNRYQPLIAYVARNPKMLDLLDELMGDVGNLSKSKFNTLYK